VHKDVIKIKSVRTGPYVVGKPRNSFSSVWVHKQFAVALMLMLCLLIGMFSFTCNVTVGLLVLFTAGENNDREAQVYSELDQLRNDDAESLEQSLVRRGEMTPFGSVMTSSIEVNVCVMLVSGDDKNIGVKTAAAATTVVDGGNGEFLLCSHIFVEDNAFRVDVNMCVKSA